MALAGGVRRVVRSSLGSSSRAFIGARGKPTVGVPSSSPSLARSPPLQQRFHVSRVPKVLGPVSSLMPLHSVTASALLTSMLSVKSRNWGWLSEGALSKTS